MRQQIICLMLLMTASAMVNLRADEPVTIVWKLEQTATVGNHPAEICGKPGVVDGEWGKAVAFDGIGDSLVVSNNPVAGLRKFTIEALFLPATDGPPAQRFLHLEENQGDHTNRVTLETRLTEGKSWSLDTFLRCGKNRCALLDRTKLHPTGKWVWVALVYDGNWMTGYVNGTKQSRGKIFFHPMAGGRTSLGARLNRVSWFKGSIQEVRFTPAVLAPKELQRVAEK